MSWYQGAFDRNRSGPSGTPAMSPPDIVPMSPTLAASPPEAPSGLPFEGEFEQPPAHKNVRSPKQIVATFSIAASSESLVEPEEHHRPGPRSCKASPANLFFTLADGAGTLDLMNDCDAREIHMRRTTRIAGSVQS